MGAVTQPLGARTPLTVTGFSTLGSGTYVASVTFTPTAAALDVVVEVECETTNVPAGNKKVDVFIQESLNGTDFRSGPTSGTSDADRPNLRQIGTVPINTASVTQRGIFSVAAVIGFCPHSLKVVLKNDIGVALTSGAVFTSEISSNVA